MPANLFLRLAWQPLNSKSPQLKIKPEPAARVRVNGQSLSLAQLAEFKQRYRTEPKPGNYWYDSVSGLYGVTGQPAYGFMYPGHEFGSLAADASAGDTSVFVNGRQLPRTEWYVWSTVLGAAIQPGKILVGRERQRWIRRR